MKLFYYGVRLLILIFFICTASIMSADFNVASTAPNFESIVKKHITRYLRLKNIPGAAVALYFEGSEHLFEFGFEDADHRQPISSNTLFEIASITKVFTSTALAMEVLKGRMKLDDPVSAYLPFTVKGLKNVSLLDLATHTSSLPRVPTIKKGLAADQQATINFLKQWEPSYPIKSKYLYSNLGYGVLGFALAEREKKSYFDVVQELILKPLGMDRTVIYATGQLTQHYAQGYNSSQQKVPPSIPKAWLGGGALKSTSADMLSFLEANLGKKGPAILIKAMKFAQKPYYKVSEKLTMGLGWQRFKTASGAILIDKNGGVAGFSSYIGMVEERDVGLVLLFNKGKSQATKIGRRILLELISKGS